MRRRAALLACLALAACAHPAAYQRPAPPVPPTWPTGESYLAQREAALPRYDWRALFADPRLQAVIGAALAHNQDIAFATAQIAAARAGLAAQRAQAAPTLDATASYREQGGTGSAGTAPAIAATNVQAGYELDLFGRLGALTGAARARYFASAAAARAARLALIADVATAWIGYGADRSLLATAEQTAAAARHSVALTGARLRGGIAPRTDLRQAEIVLHTAEADVEFQRTALAKDVNALRLLVGADVAPASLPGSIEDAERGVGEAPAGLSSEILLRRPDVLEAEWQLRAATAQIDAARAALLPRITLTGLAGFASSALTALFSGGAFAWQAAPAASYRIFGGGAGRAAVRGGEAQRDAALASYRKAIESAFADVANALARRGTIDAQLAAAEAARAAAADNLHLADLRYRGGIDSYLQDLAARQALYAAQRTAIATRQVRAANRVALYRALGGDGSLGDPAER